MPVSERSSPIRGLERREFLKYCGALAALIGVGQTGVATVAEAITQATKLPVVVWSDFQECLGCTVALLQATAPTPAQLILQQISLAYNEAAMAPAGTDAEKSFNDGMAEGAFWVIEGSVPGGMEGAFSVGGKSAQTILKENYAKAKGVIAIGSCASFGNVQARTPNPTGAMGVRAYLREKGGIPDAAVINLPRCPGHGDDLVATLVYVLVNGKLPELDAAGRPLFLYGQTIHENCERRGHFEAGEFVEKFGDEGSRNHWCLYKMGCKGPVTHAPCAINRWNGRVSWCLHAGPCTGCSEDNFWNDFSPLASPVPNIQIPAIQGVSAQQIGLGLTAVTAVGLGAHFIGQVATGRLGKGGPEEGEAKDTKGGEEVMTKVVIDPITRIEGHLRITCEVTGGKVTNAWNTSTMFRGFEIFMETIDPRDTWHYAQRICGVCPNPHALNSATAAERAMGVATVPDNARLIRNMLDATQLGYDCILWFYILNALDYVNVPDSLNAKVTDPVLKGLQDTVKAIATSGQTNPFSNQYWDHPGYQKLTPELNLVLTSHYVQAIEAQQWANQACAVIAGKFPMIMNMAAGGITQLPSIEDINYYLDRMALVKQFTEEVMWNDLLAVAGAFPELATFGKGVGNYLTWGVLDDKSQDPYKRVFPRGGIFGGKLQAEKVDPKDVHLYTKYSYYADAMGAGKTPFDVGQKDIEFSAYPPIEGPDFPTGKYDWTRAARYPSPAGKDVPMEVGPLAEVLVAYVSGQPEVKTYVDGVLAAVGAAGKPEVLLSNLGRVAARMIKARINMDHAADWANQLLANMKAGDMEVFTQPNVMAEGEGISGYDAPRGALSHYCRTSGGKVTKYAAVPASNWNLAPRDDNGVRGPVEEALVGTPVADPTKPLEILRTVHTFDP